MPDLKKDIIGYQLSADDPFTFVMSSETRDRHRDIVKQNWILNSFMQNSVALFGHESMLPIGTWENVKVISGQLIGTLKLAKKGTSELIDTIRSLVEQNILKAVSVGFISHKQSPIDESNPWGGSFLDENELMECSLCSVGSNPDALMQATKSMNISEDTRAFLKSSFAKKEPISMQSKQMPTIKQNMNKLKLLKLKEGI